jgi:hypothetical protein
VATSQQGEYPISYAKQRIGNTVGSALVLKLFLSNVKLGQAEIWTASQQGYYLPPQNISEKPTSSFGFYDQISNSSCYKKFGSSTPKTALQIS